MPTFTAPKETPLFIFYPLRLVALRYAEFTAAS